MQNFALLILMFGAIGVMMVFGSRNKKKMAAKAAELQASMVPGTRVMTTSGMHATVTAIADDTIELEIAPGIYTTWVRAAVREIVVAAPEDLEDADFAETEYSELDEADLNQLSGQDVEPIHDDHPSLEKRTNASLEKRTNDVG
ncbi:preprotein translocase subunit YajC [Nakamurella sp. UYEF19]|uniref:preprotein translocase subunit YajC n=1 Tax=Nakamurella sp. UYEF19 TaxID=1756392 RepID=UPI00339999CA